MRETKNNTIQIRINEDVKKIENLIENLKTEVCKHEVKQNNLKKIELLQKTYHYEQQLKKLIKNE